MTRKLLFIFISSIILSSCSSTKKDSRVYGHWYSFGSETNKVNKDFNYLEFYINGNTAYTYSYKDYGYEEDLTSFDFITFNDISQNLNGIIATNINEKSFRLLNYPVVGDSILLLKLDLTPVESKHTLSLKDFINGKEVEIGDYFSSYNSRGKKRLLEK